MNTWSSMLGRLLKEETPIHKEGYYILCEDDIFRYNPDLPEQIQCIYADDFVDALVDGCQEVISAFAQTPDNREVYVWSLYVDHYKSIIIYMNTVQKSRESRSKHTLQVEDLAPAEDLQYNLGDFHYQFWNKHMGRASKLIAQFESLCDTPALERDEEPLQPSDRPIIAFEAGVIDTGYYVLILKAVKKLVALNAFAPLNRTHNFIAFASTEYSDFRLTMPETISQDILYETFPEAQDELIRFQEWTQQKSHLTAGELLDDLHDIFINSWPFNPSEYDLFKFMSHHGNNLAVECLQRLDKLAELEDWVIDQHHLASCYIEALHFAGKLTAPQQKQCTLLAELFIVRDEDFVFYAQELRSLSSS
ncbi:DUF4303 domain-containing protein [Paenibacillus senegalimassiliensis]|uniref:DUF4303 domain-containing protein n=1 Tax=Paenibacillus senegalimassiliensis TaxID=1737426 RepID=UPI00073F48E0|nr:DUF4303 domain-containing protein [Paenibacillus senegalimassiliensis]